MLKAILGPIFNLRENAKRKLMNCHTSDYFFKVREIDKVLFAFHFIYLRFKFLMGARHLNIRKSYLS